MLKLFIAGHSDSGDAFLPKGSLPWTAQLAAWLESTAGQPVELQPRMFFPAGVKAVDYLLGSVREAAPDILILPLSGYACCVGVVSESVRARFGSRAHRLYLRAERGFQSRTGMEGKRRVSANRLGRRIARRVLGTRTFTTVEQSAAIYEDILHGLAQFESLQVLAVADLRFSAEVQRRNPGLNERMDRLQAPLKRVVEQHHFMWADLEATIDAAADRSIFHLPDGVHTTPAFHDAYFELLRETLEPVYAEGVSPSE